MTVATPLVPDGDQPAPSGVSPSPVSVAMREDPLRVAPLPGWDTPAPLDQAAWRARFEHDSPFRVGLEDELFLDDPRTGDLAPLPDGIREQLVAQGRFASELPDGQIEAITPACESVPEAVRHLYKARIDLADALVGVARPLSAGTHPQARLPLRITAGSRYAAIADEYAWAAHRGLASGLHVHVSVPGLDRAIAVHDALRSYLPLLTALAANAPFLEGRDTGLATVRPKLCDGLPRQGIPPALHSIEHLMRQLEWGVTSGSFPDASHLWYELRLHAQHGTVEIRVPDAATSITDTEAIASVVHSLVAYLAARQDAGDVLPVHDQARLEENRWRALRHGIHGQTADPDTGTAEPVRERLAQLLDQVEDTARQLGCDAGLTHARSLLAGNGADRQRAITARDGLAGLLEWLATETMRPPT